MAAVGRQHRGWLICHRATIIQAAPVHVTFALPQRSRRTCANRRRDCSIQV
jgi:hypothetical protein